MESSSDRGSRLKSKEGRSRFPSVITFVTTKEASSFSSGPDEFFSADLAVNMDYFRVESGSVSCLDLREILPNVLFSVSHLVSQQSHPLSSP